MDNATPLTPDRGLDLGQDKQNKNTCSKIVNIFLSTSFNICFVSSKESSHWDGSLDYLQRTF